jgi:general secretion pathway protein I
LCQRPSPELRRDGGFTLVEVLAALAVLSASMAALGALAHTSMRSSLRVERHVAEIETARKIVAGLPPRSQLPMGALTGELDAHQWRVDAAPFAAALAPAEGASSWSPQAITLQVRAPSGERVELTTVRLRQGARP